jgi:hypothetical protein
MDLVSVHCVQLEDFFLVLIQVYSFCTFLS